MSEFLLFVSNSANFYEFIGFVTFYIAEHELILVYNSFLLDLILVSMVPRATVRILKPKNLKNLKTFLKNLRFLPALVSPYFYHDAFMHNPMHVLDAPALDLGS